jgi:hypothetical protein
MVTNECINVVDLRLLFASTFRLRSTYPAFRQRTLSGAEGFFVKSTTLINN